MLQTGKAIREVLKKVSNCSILLFFLNNKQALYNIFYLARGVQTKCKQFKITRSFGALRPPHFWPQMGGWHAVHDGAFWAPIACSTGAGAAKKKFW